MVEFKLESCRCKELRDEESFGFEMACMSANTSHWPAPASPLPKWTSYSPLLAQLATLVGSRQHRHWIGVESTLRHTNTDPHHPSFTPRTHVALSRLSSCHLKAG